MVFLLNGLLSPYQIIVYLLRALVVLIAIPFHEAAHALVSHWLGDDTAVRAGRLSLNPLRHFDPLGALCMLIGGVGWAKPVGVNPRNYKNPKVGMAISAAAGPISNFLLAWVSMILYKCVIYSGLGGLVPALMLFLYDMVVMNLSLGVFNLIPVPPFDGSRIVLLFLPQRLYFKAMQYERQIMLIVLLLVFFGGLSSSGMAGIFKIVLIFASIFVGGVMAYADMGHWQGLTQSFAAYPWFSLLGRGVEDGLVSLGSMIVGVISTQTYVQALFSARDTKTAAVGCCAAALIVIPVGLPSVMIGMFMHLHHPEINSIDALPLYLVTYLPQWLGGIGLGAVLLSALGSIAGLALGVGTMISRDIVSKIWLKATAAGQLWASRLSVLAVSVTAMVFVFMHLDSSVLEWNYLSMALRGSGIFLPLTFCIFFPGRVRASMGVAAMGAGIFAALFWKHISPWEINSLLPALVYNLFFLLIGLAWGKKGE